jgi:hypothetical protein
MRIGTIFKGYRSTPIRDASDRSDQHIHQRMDRVVLHTAGLLSDGYAGNRGRSTRFRVCAASLTSSSKVTFSTPLRKVR